mmetsp:Transcript_24692/g.41174  ORF Transcript_24692/g.41174 Transcript_24692/m.41174 type:complete len:346 (-) Transcript_24692:125-1162(-)|eukprot:CAMPEP_0174953898 /NCGR_PEP_ID=MMETSP0004_2-20121128/119_1 /TAXON_ID=420556 /ORGANISM="Ochromonas sp., Strain CCMP1393" /LENGTH=345 /DNA_ID=CAMNT_0016201641 /DNA_START=55 /DNA_END=1092 /DNA_ORIENTATION=-
MSSLVLRFAVLVGLLPCVLCFHHLHPVHIPFSLTYRSNSYNPRSCQVLQKSRALRTGSDTRLFGYSNYDDEDRGVSLKVIAVAVLGVFGLFGTDLLSGFSGIRSSLTQQAGQVPTNKQELKKSSGDGTSRGALTRMTKREINFKLQAVPLFVAVSADGIGGIYTEDGIGKLFLEKSDADDYIKSRKDKNNLKVDAVTMNEVYFPLIVKKQKMGSFVEGIVGSSDSTAQYTLVGATEQIRQTPPEWPASHINDAPLYRVPNLAFNREEGLEIPLFTRKEDALNAYGRLKDGGGAAAQQAAASAPEVQVTSVLDIIALFSSGGFESRALEIYPSIDALTAAKDLLPK